MYNNFSVSQAIYHLAAIDTFDFSRNVILTILLPFSLSVGFILFTVKKPLLWLCHYCSDEKIKYWQKHGFFLSFITSSVAALLGIFIVAFLPDEPVSVTFKNAHDAYMKIFNPAPYDTIIDDNFVDPKQIHFKQKKPRNLIVIFAESLERTFTDTSLFGENLLPELSNLGGTSVIGYKPLEEIAWTQVSIIATLCGITSKEYFPPRTLSKNIACISDITRQFGYNNYYLQGTTLKFLSTRTFFEDHNFQEIVGIDELPKIKEKLSDLQILSSKLRDVNFIGNVWDDNELLKVFQQKVVTLSQEQKPFLAVMATMNTHPYDGYTSPHCRKKYKGMRDALLCSDSELSAFVKWYQQQDFAADTTLVIMGDHLMMYSDIEKYLKKASERETLNLIWGCAAPKTDIQKPFNQYDWAPTLLEMAGFEWNEQKFALGTSLLSAKKTLQEEYGEILEKRLLNNSKLYESTIFEQ